MCVEDRTTPRKSNHVGLQINTVSGIDRKISRFDLKELGSPTGAVWYFRDVDAQQNQNQNGVAVLDFEIYKNIFSAAACVVLERQVFIL